MQMRAAGLADQAKYHARRACARFVTGAHNFSLYYCDDERGGSAKAGAFYSLAHCPEMSGACRFRDAPCACGWAVCGAVFGTPFCKCVSSGWESESGNLREHAWMCCFIVFGGCWRLISIKFYMLGQNSDAEVWKREADGNRCVHFETHQFAQISGTCLWNLLGWLSEWGKDKWD